MKVIYLFTDFSFKGPYVGQLKSVLYSQAPNRIVIDLMHDAPLYNSKASAHILAASVEAVSRDGIVMGIVDPGVGSGRPGVALRADSRWYVGPDNGLFDVVANRAHAARWYEIIYQNPNSSSSFHGRDIFAPVTAMLCNEIDTRKYLQPLKDKTVDADTDLLEVIYIDSFGNLMLGVRAAAFRECSTLTFKSKTINRSNTFSDVPSGEPFFYENSQGLFEIAVNCGNAKDVLNAKIGDEFTLE